MLYLREWSWGLKEVIFMQCLGHSLCSVKEDISSFDKHLLSISSVPGPVLGVGAWSLMRDR